jgi:flagellar basal-body rod protein FlgG
MNHTLDTIASGLDASQTMLDTIADNLSNVNTTGFKSETPEFQTLLYQDTTQPGANSSGQTLYPSGLAINGAGYFQVLQPNGQTAYTRDGSFQLNQNGQLVNSSGYQVLPAVTIPANATSVTIGTDGTVSVTLPGTQTATQVGQLQLANFVNPQGLQPLGGNLYANTTSSGAAIIGAPQTNGLGSVNQDYLESSNVDVVQAMVGMISAERAYQLGTQVAASVDNELNYLAQAAAGS